MMANGRFFLCSSCWLLLTAVWVLSEVPPLLSFVTPVVDSKRACLPSWRHSPLSFVLKSSSSSTIVAVGPRLGINEAYPGLQKVFSKPDIFIVKNFLSDSECQDIIDAATAKTLERSPVAYAGWTQDFKEMVDLAAKGPVAWLALIGAWFQVKAAAAAAAGYAGGGDPQVSLVLHALQNYAFLFVLVTFLIGAFTYSRAEGLKALRTSTSTTLDDLSNPTGGTYQFVKKAAQLFNHDIIKELRQEAALFEAPTVIRYEADQVLAPHFDANRSAETEDVSRGGQTLATLLVYLNNVEKGGLTRFGRLPADAASRGLGQEQFCVQPKRGDALLFFPADAMGRFDERTEHEGCRAVDEKWIARIWRHEQRVPPPFGLDEQALQML